MPHVPSLPYSSSAAKTGDPIFCNLDPAALGLPRRARRAAAPHTAYDALCAVLAILLQRGKDREGEEHGEVGLRQLCGVLKVVHRPAIVLVPIVLRPEARLHGTTSISAGREAATERAPQAVSMRSCGASADRPACSARSLERCMRPASATVCSCSCQPDVPRDDHETATTAAASRQLPLALLCVDHATCCACFKHKLILPSKCQRAHTFRRRT